MKKAKKARVYGIAGLAVLEEAALETLGKKPRNTASVRVALFGRDSMGYHGRIVRNVLKLLHDDGRVVQQGNGWRLPD